MEGAKPRLLYPRDRLGDSQGRWSGGWKTLPPQGFDPRTVQPVASRYADYTIASHKMCWQAAYQPGKSEEKHCTLVCSLPSEITRPTGLLLPVFHAESYSVTWPETQSRPRRNPVFTGKRISFRQNRTVIPKKIPRISEFYADRERCGIF
jgi:hypothetical protein